MALALAVVLAGQSFRPDDVKVLGDLKYGQTSSPVECSTSYCAFVFNGNGNDQIEVNVNGADGKTFVVLADGSLSRLSSTSRNRIVFSLPSRGPDAEAYYIVFGDVEHKLRRFVVALKKLEK